MIELTAGQRKVLELMQQGAVLKKVAGMGSLHAPTAYLTGGPIPKYKKRRVDRDTTFRALEIKGYITYSNGDGWMTSEWVISPKGRKILNSVEE